MLTGAIVLAGGRSRRMGRPKELLPFHGNSLLGRVVDAMMLDAHPVVVVARDTEQVLPPLPLELEIAYDAAPDRGPLSGIAAGMRQTGKRCDAALVVGGDMPFLPQGLIAWLAERLGSHDCVVPRIGGTLQCLAGLYHVRLLPKIEALVAAGEGAPKALVAAVNARIVDEDELRKLDPTLRFATSIDTEADYQAALAAAS